MYVCIYACMWAAQSDTRWMGIAQRPRQVGTALRHLPSRESGNYYNGENVPWQRVVNSKAMISHRYLFPLFYYYYGLWVGGVKDS